MFTGKKNSYRLVSFATVLCVLFSGFQPVTVFARSEDSLERKSNAEWMTTKPDSVQRDQDLIPTDTPVPTETPLSTETSLPANAPASQSIPSSDIVDPLAVTTWYVATTGNDLNSCIAIGSPCLTINGAIGKAADGDTIKVATGTYTGSGDEVVLINNSITFSGGWNTGFTSQTGFSTIDAQASRRGINVNSSSAIVIIERFAIQNGLSSISPGGGGILNNGRLVLNNMIVNNSDASFGGGGILNYGQLTLSSSIVNGNSHGGLYNYGSLVIANSTISNNIDGGLRNGGDLVIDNSTINNNSHSYYTAEGGGVWSDGTLILNNSTISGNVAAGGRGGGLANNGNTIINNSTITGNSTAQGGGISNLYGVSLIIKNSIIAGNTAVTGPDCYDSIDYYPQNISSMGYNLIGNTANCLYTPNTGDLIDVNAQLAPLANNSGTTFTHALYANSPAINHGNPATPGSGGNACLATDQRGISRPLSTACDIGAFESSFSTPLPNLQDPSFEAYTPNPYWAETSTNFGTPLCTLGDCGNGAGTAAPRTGSVWSWFGGVPVDETATLSQTINIPSGIPDLRLNFYFWIGAAAPGSDAADVFTARIDGVPVFSANATQISSYASYTLVSVDVSAYSDGASHTITFSSVTTGQLVTFNLDDVALARTTIACDSGSAAMNMQDEHLVLGLPSSNNAAALSGGSTTGVFRPGNGLLYLKNVNSTGFADVAINYGAGGDYPITGDWDGNGTDTIGIYRNGLFYLRNSNTIGFADIVFAFGAPGDQPVAGDWDGDGIDTIGVYRSSAIAFCLRNSNSAGVSDTSFLLGIPGDIGIAGDWNGDGMDTTGVFRPSNGIIFLKNANTTGFADVALNYGLSGDMPVTGDWNNDGIDTIGVYRNAQCVLRNSNTIGFADIVFALGNPGDMPIAGNWDGVP